VLRLQSGPPDPIPLHENAPLREAFYPHRTSEMKPEDFGYDYDKIFVERAVMCEPELPGTILRLAAVYGPHDPQHRLFNYLKRMDDQRPAILIAEQEARWQWTRGYVENVAAAIALAVTDERSAGRIYNVGEEDALAEADWARAIGRAAGWEGLIVTATRDLLPPQIATDLAWEHHLALDTSRIREELGYSEHITRDEALKRAITWERANPPDNIDPKQFDYATEDEVLEKLKQMS
jgi:nucleoside-diphosphate-sugar epimerase